MNKSEMLSKVESYTRGTIGKHKEVYSTPTKMQWKIFGLLGIAYDNKGVIVKERFEILSKKSYLESMSQPGDNPITKGSGIWVIIIVSKKRLPDILNHYNSSTFILIKKDQAKNHSTICSENPNNPKIVA